MPIYPGTASSQRGYALLMTTFVALMAMVTVGLALSKPGASAVGLDERGGDAFASVKNALIGYAVRRGVATCANPGNPTECNAELAARPGELPCPDTNNDGLAEATCAGTGQRIGWVPWKTLGIPEPKDSAGETLWYAVALPFLSTASNPISGGKGYINSGTVGDLSVLGPGGAQRTNSAVAIIFAPGPTLPGQNRSSLDKDAAPCPATGQTEIRSRCRSNYLESVISATSFQVDSPGNDINDQLVYLLTTELMPIVEMRVGKEMRDLLTAYRERSNCRCYPWADSWNYSGGIADVGVNRGRFPSTAYPENWGTGTIPKLPPWLAVNDWHNVVFYSAARQETELAGAKCYYCSPLVTLAVRRLPSDTVAEAASAVLFTPGLPKPGVVRPNNPTTAQANQTNLNLANNLGAYLEDALNNNKTTCPGNSAEHANGFVWFPPSNVSTSCDTYVQPQSRGYDRDRLHMIKTTPGAHCAPAARALIANAPCKDSSPDEVKDVCTNLATSLSTCGCSAAATALTVVPCRNTLNSSSCDAPIAALQSC